MRSIEETKKALNAIRSIVDADIIDSDIDEQKNKLLKLTQLIGLSAEAKASAKKILYLKELQTLKEIDETMQATRMTKELNAKCFEEQALLEYADRLNSALIHSIDAIRSVISLYKTELENSLKG